MYEMLVYTEPTLRGISRQCQRPQGAFVPVFVTINFVKINILPKKKSLQNCTSKNQYRDEENCVKTHRAHPYLCQQSTCAKIQKNKNRKNMLKNVRWEHTKSMNSSFGLPCECGGDSGGGRSSRVMRDPAGEREREREWRELLVYEASRWIEF